MTPIEQEIRDRIRRHGPISVAEYMAIALGHAGDGYYRRGNPIGAAGDFITAPEISQAFGELIGLWCAVTWRQMGTPATVRLVELGPGRGTLMADALRAALSDPEFLDAAKVHLVETSPTLRRLQQEALHGVNATWHDSLDPVPDEAMILIANEFFDALPVEQFVRTEGGWRSRCIGLDESTKALRFTVSEEAVDTDARLPGAAALACVGAIVETSPDGLSLAGAIAARIARGGGAALIMDYGPERSAPGESLQAVAGHGYHDVLARPGEADLTAHVDFEALSAASAAMGTRVHGPVPQGDFLLRLGLEMRAERLMKNASPEQARHIRSGCRRLTDPAEMGQLFKVMAVVHCDLPPPAGFEE